MSDETKILVVGLPRTGTYSTAVALAHLGYTSLHYPMVMENIATHDACSEVRFPIADLEQHYPQSKYILTTRKNTEAWLASCNKHIVHKVPGWNPFWDDQSKWVEAYNARLKEVEIIEPSRLLLIDVDDGGDAKWEKLCNFLGKEIPNIPFPHFKMSERHQ